MNSRHCFCGCEEDIATANQLSGNLLGWDLTHELGEWMRATALLEVTARDRDRSNEEAFIGDGRAMWLSLRDQVHDGSPQSRSDRKTTNRWLKFSKKERKKLDKAVASIGFENPFKTTEFTPEEIRAWLLIGDWPPWTALPISDEDMPPSQDRGFRDT